MMLMQRFLPQEALRQARAVHFMLVGVRGPPCSHVLRLSQPTAHHHHHRWLSTSDSSSKVTPRAKDECHRLSFTTKQPVEDEPHHLSSSTVPHPEVGPHRSPGSTPGSQEAAGSSRPHDGSEEASSSTAREENSTLQGTSVGLYQRFKKTFQQYGKVMIPVHVVTSSVWVGMFYCAAMRGVNVVPFLEFIGLPDSILNLLRHSSTGYLLTALALYKIITPVRYIVTVGGTKIIVQYLRKHGYLSKPPSVKEYFKDRRARRQARKTTR